MLLKNLQVSKDIVSLDEAVNSFNFPLHIRENFLLRLWNHKYKRSN